MNTTREDIRLQEDRERTATQAQRVGIKPE